MVTTTDIANTIPERIANIPTSMQSGTNLLNMVEDAKKDVQNALSVSIDSNNVPSQYESVIRYKAFCNALMATHSSQSDYNVSTGEVSVSKADGLSPERTQMNYYQAEYDKEIHDLKMAGASSHWGQTFYGSF